MANIKKQLDSLLNQEMDRKNFLKYSGGILLAVLGITGLIRILMNSSRPGVTPEEQPQGPSGYGASRYGQ